MTKAPWNKRVKASNLNGDDLCNKVFIAALIKPFPATGGKMIDIRNDVLAHVGRDDDAAFKASRSLSHTVLEQLQRLSTLVVLDGLGAPCPSQIRDQHMQLRRCLIGSEFTPPHPEGKIDLLDKGLRQFSSQIPADNQHIDAWIESVTQAMRYAVAPLLPPKTPTRS